MADKTVPRVTQILETLESHYGPQEPNWPTDPYEFLVWWYSGYPASDAACAKGWASLNQTVGIRPEQILAAGAGKLAQALKPGGMVPELRAERLLELASRVHQEFGGDLCAGLAGPLAQARKLLQQFHSIAGPGTDRILLFAGIAPLPAVPSNCPYVLVRIRTGREHENYGQTYRQAQETIRNETAEKFDARTRAYLLLKRHGQELCKSTKPKCDRCPLQSHCAYVAKK